MKNNFKTRLNRISNQAVSNSIQFRSNHYPSLLDNHSSNICRVIFSSWSIPYVCHNLSSCYSNGNNVVITMCIRLRFQTKGLINTYDCWCSVLTSKLHWDEYFRKTCLWFLEVEWDQNTNRNSNCWRCANFDPLSNV